MYNNHFTSAIILMGGKGDRFNSPIPKQFHLISGKEIYIHTLDVFISVNIFDEIILVCPEQWVEHVKKHIKDFSNIISVVNGGKTRQESSYLGLKSCKYRDIVTIHDAVRLFVTKDIILSNIEKAIEYKAVNTCIPSTDTIIQTTDFKTISSVPDRKHYWRGQTPQSFQYPLILKAHEEALKKDIFNASDDCCLVRLLNKKVAITPGNENNIKITSSLDLFLAEQLFRLPKAFSLKKNNNSLKGKCYALLGATGGIGTQIHQLLKNEEATVIPLSRKNKDFPVDLTDPSSIQNTFDRIHQKYPKIDGLINSAGMLIVKPFSSLSLNEIIDQVSINFLGLIIACHAAKIKKQGHIINISSSSFYRGRKYFGVYSAAKAAVVNFSQSLAEERKDLFIHTVIPQRTNTLLRTKNFPNEPKESLISPLEVAKTVIELLKDKTSTNGLVEVKKNET